MKKIAVFGAGGFGREVAWLIRDIHAQQQSFEFIGYFDDHFEGQNKIPATQNLGGMHALNNWPEALGVVIAVGNPLVKRKIVEQINNPLIHFPTLIHPSVIYDAESVTIGEGSIICAGCILTVDLHVGRHVILNLDCTVGHDAVIGDFSSFMPSVNISGEVTFGEAVYAGTGATFVNQLLVGEETIVGAGAVVSKSLPPKCTAVGVPAKPIKFNE